MFDLPGAGSFEPLFVATSLLVDALAKLVWDVRLSDRLNVSRKFRNDDNDVDFFGEPLLLLLTSSSLSVRTYKFPIFSLIFTDNLFFTKQLTQISPLHKSRTKNTESNEF